MGGENRAQETLGGNNRDKMSEATKMRPRRPPEAGNKPRRPQELRIQPKRPQYPYRYTLELERGGLRRPPRKNNALRKKWSEGYIAKEK